MKFKNIALGTTATAVMICVVAAGLVQARAYHKPEVTTNMLNKTTVDAVKAAPVTIEQAKATAEKYVPSGSNLIESKNDYKEYDIKFINEAKNEIYEIEIDKITGMLISFESEVISRGNSKNVVITTEQAEQTIKNEYKDASIISSKLDYDDGFNEYEVIFSTPSYYGEIDINSETGSIIKRKIKMGAIAELQMNYNPPAVSGTSPMMSFEEISARAIEEMPNAIVTDIDLDRTHNGYIYKIEVYKDNVEYDLIFDASTGTKISSEYDGLNNSNTNTTNYIGLDKAKEIAISKAGTGASLYKIELDNDDDGHVFYEGELRKGNIEYDFKIDAFTGNILEWEQDIDD